MDRNILDGAILPSLDQQAQFAMDVFTVPYQRAVTVASFFVAGNTFHGVVSMPPPIAPTLLQLDIQGALSVGILNVVLVFFLVELFDATGTLMGVTIAPRYIINNKAHRNWLIRLFLSQCSIQMSH
ncbi:hypothetical protein ACH51_19730 (plasmid) [Ralstonia solanacearum]|nr:hypothetical protein ACH51_19730 [Ralstonia solanacearum]